LLNQELELIIGVVSLILSLNAWVKWYRDLASVNPLRGLMRQRFVLFVTPLFCLLLLVGLLKKLSAATVRDDPLYIAFYALLGAGWLSGATLIFPFLGASARDDVLERANIPAVWLVVGALLGVSFSFAGANIGDGPGVEAVLLSAVLSSGMFFALWLGMDVLTSISEMITVERDESAGIRMAGLLPGIGLLTGWSVAGDWTSASATLKDFALSSWPAILLAVIAMVAELVLRRTSHKSSKAMSFLISALYVSVALAWVVARGFRS
jgi:hypothetical protein